MPLVQVHWPLYTVYPAATGFFWVMYLFVSPRMSSRFIEMYDEWPRGQQMVWRQCINYLLHSVMMVIALVGVLVSSEGAELRQSGLMPHYSKFAYIDVCLSLGYMSFTLPWSFLVYFWMKRRDMGTNKGLIVHHCAVVVAELVYLLTQTSPWYGALSLVLFEVSNLNAAPHLLMTQLRYTGIWHFLNGICFLITYTGSRIISCTVIGVLYVRDYANFSGEWGIWLAVALSLTAYWVLMTLSYYWFYRDVMTVTHFELKRYFGERYYTKCCPAPLISCVGRLMPMRKATGPHTTTSTPVGPVPNDHA